MERGFMFPPHEHGPHDNPHRTVRVVKVRRHGRFERPPEEYDLPEPFWADLDEEEGRGPGNLSFRRPPWSGHGGHGHRPGGPWGRRGGPRVGRGDVRAATLLLLAERPLHGYQIIQEISDWSGGLWRPSPGSVYPALQMLE